MTRLKGKTAYITDRDSLYYGEWGTVVEYDGDVYYIAIADGKDSVPVFDRSQFKVRRKTNV